MKAVRKWLRICALMLGILVLLQGCRDDDELFQVVVIDSQEELEKFEQQLQDRFGRIPRQVLELFDGLRLRWISKKMGFEPKKDISTFVDIQYQPKGDQKVSWIDFFGTNNLNRINKICGHRMQKLGYPLR